MSHESESVLVRGGGAKVVPSLALVTLLVTFVFDRWTLPGWAPLDVAAGLAVPFGALFGVYGALAVGLGLLGRAVTAGGPTPLTIIRIGGYVLVGLVAAATWRSTPTTGAVRALPAPVWLVPYLATTAVSVAAGSAALSLAAEVIGHSPFFLAAQRTVASGVAALVLGTPVLWLASHLAVPASTQSPGSRPDRSVFATLALVSFGWLVLGTIGSISYQSFAVLYTYDSNALRTIGLEPLRVLHNDAVFGHGAVRGQIVLGGVMVMLLVLTLWRTLGTAEGVSQCD